MELLWALDSLNVCVSEREREGERRVVYMTRSVWPMPTRLDSACKLC